MKHVGLVFIALFPHYVKPKNRFHVLPKR
jgi:hypothetical protein